MLFTEDGYFYQFPPYSLIRRREQWSIFPVAGGQIDGFQLHERDTKFLPCKYSFLYFFYGSAANEDESANENDA